MFAARVRNGFVPALRATVVRKFKTSKVANARSLTCLKARRDVGVRGELRPTWRNMFG